MCCLALLVRTSDAALHCCPRFFSEESPPLNQRRRPLAGNLWEGTEPFRTELQNSAMSVDSAFAGGSWEEKNGLFDS